MKKVSLCALSLLILAGFSHFCIAKEAKKVNCTGKVVDNDGQPISDAKVKLYKVITDRQTFSFDIELTEQISTKEDGAFSFEAAMDSNYETNQSIIFVEKKPLAFGWANWRHTEDLNTEIVLGKPAVFGGTIVDTSGNPITDAQVSIFVMMMPDPKQSRPRHIIDEIAQQFFSTTTDIQGKFQFEGIPENASAEFQVTKPDMGTVNTFDPRTDRGEQLQYAAGREGIAIELQEAATINGVVASEETGEGIAGVKLMVTRGQDQPSFGIKPIVSETDGRFSIDSLSPGRYILMLPPTREKGAEWVAEPVELSVEAGETKNDLTIEVNKGGLLEIIVTEAETGDLVEQAYINITNTQNNQRHGARTDANGIAQIRSSPGEYQISVHHQDFTSSGQQEIVTIENGKTTKAEMELQGQPKITGTVSDPDGKPIEGVQLRVLPAGHRDSASDEQGRFEVQWNPQYWGSRDTIFYLIARDIEGNLAAAVEVDEEKKQMDVTLQDGVVFEGQVTDEEGKNIEDAKISVSMRSSSWGATISYERNYTNEKGYFEVKAIPKGQRYNVTARADGFGKARRDVYSDEAVDNRLDMGTFTLPLANLSVSGVVVDVNDEPVEGARINCYGDKQPNYHDIRSDEEGKFVIEKVCEGRLRINASTSGPSRKYASIETDGGVEDIKIVLSDRSSRTQYAPKEPGSLEGEELPDFSDFTIELAREDVNDKAILICFFDMMQRPSRHLISQLGEMNTQLNAKDIVLAAIQATDIEKEQLKDWIEKQDYEFLIGQIEDDTEKTQFNWGVKSLPWLILTDSEHVVRAEGFVVSELEEIIK